MSFKNVLIIKKNTWKRNLKFNILWTIDNGPGYPELVYWLLKNAMDFFLISKLKLVVSSPSPENTQFVKATYIWCYLMQA